MPGNRIATDNVDDAAAVVWKCLGRGLDRSRPVLPGPQGDPQLREMTRTRARNRAIRGVTRTVCTALLTACAGQPAPETGPAPGPPAAAEPAPGAPTMASFTAAQVERGRAVFDAVCGECHALGDFRGSTFLYEWRRRTAWNFFRTVSETMPDDAPGSLSDAEYVDVVSYVLSLNGYEPGERELPALRDALDTFVMDGAPGGS